MWGIILAAALAGTLLWATGIGVSGRKTLEYKQDVREGKSSDIAWDNEEANYTEVDSEDEAYKIIGEKLGIPVLKLGYRPEGMEFKRLILEENFAFLEFEYNEKKIHLIESSRFNENSDALSSDRKEYIEVENEWLDRKLRIEKNLNTEKELEYSLTLEQDKNFYYLEGIVTEEEFKQVAMNLNF